MHKKILNKIHHWTIPHEGNEYKPYAIRHKTLVVYSVLMIFVKVFLVGTLFLSFPDKAQFSTITTNRIIQLTNKEREKLGLPYLQHSKVLDSSALKKAQEWDYSFSEDARVAVGIFYKAAKKNYPLCGIPYWKLKREIDWKKEVDIFK